MRLLVDGHEIPLDRATLAAAIAAGAGEAESRGRMVVEVKADGITLDERDIESAPDVPGTFQEIRLVTASRDEMAAGVLRAAEAALGDLVAAQRHVADQILATRLEPAASGLQEVLNVWQSVHDATDQICLLLAQDLPTLASRADRADQADPALAGLTSALSQVRSTVQSQDWSSLADLLTDELTDLARMWQGLLGAIATSLYDADG